MYISKSNFGILRTLVTLHSRNISSASFKQPISHVDPNPTTCPFVRSGIGIPCVRSGIGFRGFSVSSTLQKASTRKIRAKNLLDKYMKGQNKKTEFKTFDIWENISAMDLAKVLDVDPDEIFDLILTIDPNLLSDEFQPIYDKSLFRELSKKLRCKFKYILDPRKKKHVTNEDEKNLDVKHIPPKMEDLQPRPPVCAIVGHIDHGKTTLLDHLRKSSIVSLEYGGITQHIGAFSVALPMSDGKTKQNITFLDTPGHAAFKSMRIRGANITDIVILVVDVAEGPLEQTFESIKAIKDARVSMIVALNKIDKRGANVEGTKQQLYDAGVSLEEFGGDVQSVPISALHGTNVQLLIEAILAQAEVLQLAGDFKGPVEGTVVESTLDSGLGKTAVVLIKRGTLKKGDFLVCGETYAKVKMLLNTGATLEDEKANRMQLKEVKPSEACKIVGWKELPHAGEEVLQVESEKRAIQVIEWRKEQEAKKRTLDDLKVIEKRREIDHQKYVDYRMKKLSTGIMKPKFGRFDFHVREKELENEDETPKVSIVVKADVDGSLDALIGCLKTYKEQDVNLDVIHVGVGGVTETDLKLAQDFEGIVYSFNSDISDKTRQMASFLNVQIREFNVIYALIDDLKSEISQKIPPVDIEVPLGKGHVQQEFLVSVKNKKVPVAGCKVFSGKFDKSKRFKVTRNNGSVTVFDGSLVSLKYFKDEVQQITAGQDCGLRVEDTTVRFEERDQIICYDMDKEKRVTQWSPGF